MEQSFVENIDRRRYRLILWQTIGFAVWYIPPFFVILKIVQAKWLLGVILLLSLAGCALFGVALFRLTRLGKQIKADSKLSSAVNNELYIANSYKAVAWGYYVTMAAIVILYAISIYVDIPGRLMASILIFVGVFSSNVAQLIFQRD